MKIAKKFAARRALYSTPTIGETLTDQAAAKDTDINRIVATMGITGQVPGTRQPMYGDFSNYPTDLRGFIEMGRSLSGLREQLPDALKDRSLDELAMLTDEQINNILKPPEKPADPKPPEKPAEPKKEEPKT